MTEQARPRLILVHGAWVGPWEFGALVDVLHDRGWIIDTVSLPSVGSTVGIADDAGAVTAALDASPEPAILVAHSYGGIPVTEAGDHPNVERIVYVAAFALGEGESALSTMGRTQPDWWDVADGMVSVGHSRAERVAMLAADLPPEAAPVAEQLADVLRPHSYRALTEPVTRVAWHTKPVTYILTENDAIIPPPFQEALATRCSDDVVRIAHGHSPFAEDPVGFADLLERVVLGTRPEVLTPGA